MKMAFNGQAHYPNLDEGYELYVKRSRNGACMSYADYKRVLKAYCKILAGRLEETGMVDLPCKLGSICAAMITRKPQFRGDKFIGYGKKDWKSGQYDSTLKTFGLVFLPRHGKNQNLRSFGFVANRRLFKKVKEKYISGKSDWKPLDFNDGMI